MTALRALLEGIVDYAGLFPPAGLDMSAAAADYARHRRGPDAWMLGRFVVTAKHLPELALALSSALVRDLDAGAAWRVAALLGADLEADLRALTLFGATEAPRAVVDTLEGKATRPEEVHRLLEAAPSSLVVYVEVPLEPDPTPLLTVIAARGARAKVRSGGLSAGAVPTPRQLARFLAGCAALRLPFKATAGLHHPLRSEHAFTYAADSPRGVMHGFLNLFVAAALLREGRIDVGGAEELLAEGRVEAFVFDADELRVGPHCLSARELAGARGGFAISFGSCSFGEPLADLRALGLLAAA